MSNELVISKAVEFMHTYNRHGVGADEALRYVCRRLQLNKEDRAAVKARYEKEIDK